MISTWLFLSTGLMQYGSLIYLIHLFTLSLHYIALPIDGQQLQLADFIVNNEADFIDGSRLCTHTNVQFSEKIKQKTS